MRAPRTRSLRAPSFFACVAALVSSHAAMAQAERGAARSAPPPPLVISGASIVDLRAPDGASLEGAVIVIEDGLIRCVDLATACPTPAGATHLDAAGRWLLPGLIDSHVHLTWSTNPDAARQAQALRFAYGVTTVREASTGVELEANLLARAEAEAARAALPRMVVSGQVSIANLELFGAPDMAGLVQHLAGLGVDAIKFKGPTDEEMGGPGVEHFAPERLRAASFAAHEAGLPFYGHWVTGPPPDFAIIDVYDARFDGVSHLYPFAPTSLPDNVALPPPPGPGEDRRVWNKSLWLYADEAKLAAMAEEVARRGVWLEPLLVTELYYLRRFEPPPEAGAWVSVPFLRRSLASLRQEPRSAEVSDRLEQVAIRILRFIREFYERGGMLTTGTDSRGVPGHNLHDEMEALAESGIPRAEALRAATLNGAKALRRDRELGTLEPGKRADLLILDADPLADVRNARRIWRIVKGGATHDPAEILRDMERRGRPTEPGSGGLLGSPLFLVFAAASLVALAGVAGARWRSRRGAP